MRLHRNYRKDHEMTASTMLRPDEEIQRDVLAELKWDARVAPNEIGVAVKDGVVSLTGWVDSFIKKWAAERAAHRVRGVKAVANDIEVRVPASEQKPDPDIAAAVTRALEWDAFVPIENLDVTVSKGWVTLKGEVEWEFQRRAAERAVRRLSAVRGVTNLITVRPRVTPSPTELKRQIERSLVRSAETDAENITIETAGSKVVLRGTVRSWAEREEAERVAWSAPGATEVENLITVRP
jgi:osmotically-inducible protein OsmY